MKRLGSRWLAGKSRMRMSRRFRFNIKDVSLRKKYNPDFLVADEVLVEIKALSKLTSTEESQIINYLKAAGKRVGLLMNFGAASLEFKRYVGQNGKIVKVRGNNL